MGIIAGIGFDDYWVFRDNESKQYKWSVRPTQEVENINHGTIGIASKSEI